MKKLVFLALLALILIPSTASAQAFENTPAVLIGPGLDFPFGDATDFWGTAIMGRLTIRFPVLPTITFGLDGTIKSVDSDFEGVELLQVPLLGILYWPMAAEAASTPYVGVGGGVTINHFSYQEDILPGLDSETKTRACYALLAGYAIRPESMSSTIFDLQIRYEQQIINNEPDWRNVGVHVAIGLALSG